MWSVTALVNHLPADKESLPAALCQWGVGCGVIGENMQWFGGRVVTSTVR